MLRISFALVFISLRVIYWPFVAGRHLLDTFASVQVHFRFLLPHLVGLNLSSTVSPQLFLPLKWRFQCASSPLASFLPTPLESRLAQAFV